MLLRSGQVRTSRSFVGLDDPALGKLRYTYLAFSYHQDQWCEGFGIRNAKASAGVRTANWEEPGCREPGTLPSRDEIDGEEP